MYTTYEARKCSFPESEGIFEANLGIPLSRETLFNTRDFRSFVGYQYFTNGALTPPLVNPVSSTRNPHMCRLLKYSSLNRKTHIPQLQNKLVVYSRSTTSSRIRPVLRKVTVGTMEGHSKSKTRKYHL